jgi:hypothetical protein
MKLFAVCIHHHDGGFSQQGGHTLKSNDRIYAAVSVTLYLVRRLTLGKKVVAHNSTLIHPGPQVNSTGTHSFSHKSLFLLDMMKISPGIRHQSFF